MASVVSGGMSYRVFLKEVCLALLLFILYTHDMWFGLENKLVAYADDATLLAVVPSPDMRPSVSESLNRDLAKINEWCQWWGMKMNPRKTQSMIVSRSRNHSTSTS